MRLLLISNSTNAGEAYLDYPKMNIKDFLGSNIKKTLFIPYAGVTFSFDEYAQKVQSRFDEIGYTVDSIHKYENPVAAVENAEAIVVGGGNTFQLIKMMHENKLMEAIRKKVLAGTPFVGWSAGSNVACPTICTTNDMPIVEPESFKALNLVPFQINPHYIDANPDGHAGETREQRIAEFLVANPTVTVIGLREGTMLLVENKKMSLVGNRSARIFKKVIAPYEITDKEDFSEFIG
ncbi:MAG: dipeptidase E [Bacteroidetes bacterium RIFOXYA12_FULL_35_11]|nr:MAG: dipeptidase E [Bacteroidetes bacterium GWF2_35_48]OFY73377.1 MAG: dipeptidase E [Bacteroidetes bacterium RIFOXYA12_FULL_35_11]OFZ00178.1 MAG: dipeptidase E [Bacteroidetes bacterium RIFOXYC12_FULL_35_7]HBX53607.1 dipeptidase PepE [Bacteroidales bacterium]